MQANPESLTDASIDRFLQFEQEMGLRLPTCRMYGSQMRTLLNWSGRQAICHSQLEETTKAWLTERRAHCSPATVRQGYAASRKFARWAGLGDDFMKGYRLPRNRPPEPTTLIGGMRDIQAMMGACTDGTERTLVSLCGMLGLRVEEARSLTVGAVDLERHMVRVDGKGGKRRLNPLYSGPAQHVIGRMIAVGVDNPDARLVELTDSTARRRLKVIARNAGITQAFHSHMLRATFATHLQRESGDTTLVQKWLGHSDISTTMRYVALPVERMAEAVEDWNL